MFPMYLRPKWETVSVRPSVTFCEFIRNDASKRAFKLLVNNLDTDQYRDYFLRGYFLVRKPDGALRAILPVNHHCVHPVYPNGEIGYPICVYGRYLRLPERTVSHFDGALALKFAIEMGNPHC
jgi:hypothetical protein